MLIREQKTSIIFLKQFCPVLSTYKNWCFKDRIQENKPEYSKKKNMREGIKRAIFGDVLST